MDELIGKTVSDENDKEYNILEEINAGVFGVIMKVSNQKNETFAMKIFKNSHPSILSSWEIEVKAMKAVMDVAVQKNIVRIVDSGLLNEDDLPDGLSNHFLVMNMLGPSVFEVMNPKEPHEMYGRRIAFDCVELSKMSSSEDEDYMALRESLRKPSETSKKRKMEPGTPGRPKKLDAGSSFVEYKKENIHQLLDLVERSPSLWSGIDENYHRDDLNNSKWKAIEKECAFLFTHRSGKDSDIKSIAYQVAVAMIELHKSKIIHLDLKPENICFVKTNNDVVKRREVDGLTLVSMENTQVQIVDLGCAVFLTDEEPPEHFINHEAQTQNYRAPEVFLGLGVSRKSDVWSYGCILSELYTGDLLFFGATDKNSEEEQLDVMTFVLQRSIPYKMFEDAFDYGSRKVTMTKKGLHFHKFNMSPVDVATIFACVRGGDRYGMYLYDLILLILEMDPEDRPSFSEIIKNEYFSDNLVIEFEDEDSPPKP